MIKNIIFDVGGVIFDDKNNNLVNKFNISEEKTKEITKIAFTNNFQNCMLGYESVADYITTITEKYSDIKYELQYLIDPKFYYETFPLKKDVYNLIIKLYDKGYNLYILSNNTKDSFEYVSSIMNLKYFKGIVSSYQEHIIKPNNEIYDLIISRYKLNKEETIFIDDSSTNIEAATKVGIKSIKFNTIEDIIYLLDYK